MVRRTGDFAPPDKTGKVIGTRRLARFNLDGKEGCVIFDHYIHLVTLLVSPEKHGGRLAMVVIGFGEFRDDLVFKQRTSKRTLLHFVGRSEAQQSTRQARVIKVEFGGFNYPLVEVPVMGGEQKDDKARLQDGYPPPCRVHRDSGIHSQVRVVQLLA